MKLHPSFAVDEHTLTSADVRGTFATPTITGWGVFELQVEVHWKPDARITSIHDVSKGQSPPLMLAHMLELASSVVSRTIDLQHLYIAPEALSSGGISAHPAAAAPAPSSSFFGRLFGAQPTSSPAGPSDASRVQRMSTPHARFVSSNATPAPAPIQITTGKPTNPKHTVLAMVVDRSGSMQSMGSEVEGGCNAYLDEQRKSDAEDATTTHVVMCTFDNQVDCLHDNVELPNVTAITHEQVKPRGMTALYDAIGDALTRTAAVVNGLDHAPNVTIFILTDGQENSSHKWSKQAIAAEISKLQTPAGGGWDFYFAAANQDAMAEGSRLGMDTEQCMTFGNSGAKMKSAMVYAKQAHTRKSKGMTKGFSSEERSMCM